MSLFTTFSVADILSFSVCMIMLFGFCAGIIPLKAWIARRGKDRDMARCAKLDQMMYTNATNEAKRAARVIEETIRITLNK